MSEQIPEDRCPVCGRLEVCKPGCPMDAPWCTGQPLGPMGEIVHHSWCPVHG